MVILSRSVNKHGGHRQFWLVNFWKSSLKPFCKNKAKLYRKYLWKVSSFGQTNSSKYSFWLPLWYLQAFLSSLKPLTYCWHTNVIFFWHNIKFISTCFFQILYVDNKCPAFTTKYQYFMTHDPDVLRVKKENQVLVKQNNKWYTVEPV